MPDDNSTIRVPQAGEIIQSPPRRQPRPADPCAMVIFGASGDLTKRLVMPALYNLARTKVLPENFALIGVARAEETAESWRGHLYDMLKSFRRQRRQRRSISTASTRTRGSGLRTR